MEGLKWWCIHDLKLSLGEGGRRGEDDDGEARAKAGWEDGPIYCEPGPAGRLERKPILGRELEEAKIAPPKK
jgi:hypothetical protein